MGDVFFYKNNVEGDDETPETKRFKMTTADCWNFATKIGPIVDGIDRENCNECGKVFRTSGKNHGTIKLNLHMDGCPKLKYVVVGQVMINL